MSGEREKNTGISALVGRTFSIRKQKPQTSSGAGAAAAAATHGAGAAEGSSSGSGSGSGGKSIDLLRSKSAQGEVHILSGRRPSGGTGTDYGSAGGGSSNYNSATVAISPSRAQQSPTSPVEPSSLDGFHNYNATVGSGGGGRLGRSGSTRRTAIETLFGSSPKLHKQSNSNSASNESHSSPSSSKDSNTPPPYSSIKSSSSKYPPSTTASRAGNNNNNNRAVSSRSRQTSAEVVQNNTVTSSYNPFKKHEPLTRSNLRPSRSFDSLTTISRRSSIANSTIDSPIETTSGGSFVPENRSTTPTHSNFKRDTYFDSSSDGDSHFEKGYEYQSSPSHPPSTSKTNKHSHSQSVANPIRRTSSITRTLATGPPPRPAISSTTRAKPNHDAPPATFTSPYSPTLMGKRVTGRGGLGSANNSVNANSMSSEDVHSKGRIIPKDALSNVHDHMRARQELIGAGPFFSVQRGWKKGVYTSRAEAERQIKNFPGPLLKEFEELDEAIAFLTAPPKPAPSSWNSPFDDEESGITKPSKEVSSGKKNEDSEKSGWTGHRARAKSEDATSVHRFNPLDADLASAMEGLGAAFKSPTFPTAFQSHDSSDSNTPSSKTETPPNQLPQISTFALQDFFSSSSSQPQVENQPLLVSSPVPQSSSPSQATNFLNATNVTTLLPVKSVPLSISFYESVLGFSLLSNLMDLNAIMCINGGVGICLRAIECFPQGVSSLGRATSTGKNGNSNRTAHSSNSSSGTSSERNPLSPSIPQTQSVNPTSPVLASSSLPASSTSENNKSGSSRDRSNSSATLMDSNTSIASNPAAPNQAAANVRRSSSISRSKASTPPPPPPPRNSSSTSTHSSGSGSGMSFLIQCSSSLESVRMEIEKRLNTSNGTGRKWENARLLGGIESKSWGSQELTLVDPDGHRVVLTSTSSNLFPIMTSSDSTSSSGSNSGGTPGLTPVSYERPLPPPLDTVRSPKTPQPSRTNQSNRSGPGSAPPNLSPIVGTPLTTPGSHQAPWK